MASEVHDLLVRLRPEGAEETRQELEETTEQFEESADQTDEAAGNMSDFADKFKGAMNVVVAGLAVGAAGLLTQVPVIGEAASGLFAIIDAIAFKMDEVLRPAIGPLTANLFEVADAINRSDGAFGDFIGTAASIAAIIGIAELAVLGLNAALGASITGPIAGIIGILGGPVTLILLAVIALIGLFAYAWENNLFNIRDNIQAFVGEVLEGDLFGALEALLQLWEDIQNGILRVTAELVGGVLRMLFSLFNRWLTRQQMKFALIRTAFETLFALIINEAKGWANTFVGIIEEAVNRAIRATPDAIREELGLTEVSIRRPFAQRSTSSILASGRERLRNRQAGIAQSSRERAGEAERQISRLVEAMQNNPIELSLSLDSREVASETKPYFDETVTARGRGVR